MFFLRLTFFFCLSLLSSRLLADYGLSTPFASASQSLDTPLNIPFSADSDFGCRALAIYCISNSNQASVQASLHEDRAGKPATAALSSALFVPQAQSWSTLPLSKSVPLVKGKRYHLLLRLDTQRGGAHAVDAKEILRSASFEKNSYVLYGNGTPVQGRPFSFASERPIRKGQMQAQVLHFHCGMRLKGLKARIRSQGQPEADLMFRLYRHNYHTHQTQVLREGLFAKAASVPESWRWIEFSFADPLPEVQPECYYIAFHSESEKGGYALSEDGVNDGLRDGEALSFDGGAHLSRASSSQDGKIWKDDFNRDAHVVALGGDCPPAQGGAMDTIPALDLARNSARMRLKTGSFSQAMISANEAVLLAENTLGETHPSVIPLQLEAAEIEEAWGKLAESEKRLRWAQALAERSDTPSSKRAQVLLQLSRVLNRLTRPLEAGLAAKQSMALSATAQALIQSAKAAQSLGDLGGARKAYSSAELLLKNDDEGRALLWEAWSAVETAKSAEAMLRKGLELRRKIYGQGHGLIAQSLQKLGEFLTLQGRQTEANPLFEEALKIRKTSLGLDQFESLPYLESAAFLYEKLGQTTQAKTLNIRIRKIRLASYGTE